MTQEELNFDKETAGIGRSKVLIWLEKSTQPGAFPCYVPDWHNLMPHFRAAEQEGLCESIDWCNGRRYYSLVKAVANEE